MRDRRVWTGAAVVSAVALAVAVVPDVRAGDSPSRDTSVRTLLDRAEIDVAERSRAYPVVDETAGCGDVTGGRMVVDGDPGDWLGEPTGINGTDRYDGGEYVWTDYPFDDAGTGELRYPGEREAGTSREGAIDEVSSRNARYGGNAADVVELRLAADETHLHVLTRLNFLNAVDTTVVGLGFDLDGESETGFTDWPLGARLATDGVDLFLTLHGTCGFVTTAGGGDRTLADAGGAVRVDTRTNAMEAALPLALLGGSRSFTVVGGAGLWDAAAGRWMQPVAGGPATNASDDVTGARTDSDPAVFNLLFRTDEPLFDPNNVLSTGQGMPTSRRVFQVARQIEVLSTGTTGPFGVTVDLDRLQPGAPSDPMPVRRGDDVSFTRQYRSRLDLEGLLFVGNQLVYLSRHQPYAVHVPGCYESGCAQWPDGPAGRAPLAMNFHGGDGSHLNQIEAEAGARVAAGLADEVGAVTAAPLGRGRRQPWWRGPGELDMLEVVEDVERAYGTDPDRRLATGASLGGYATTRFASLYPDMWAGAAAHCPATYENSTSAREPGNEVEQSQNFTVEPIVPSMLNVPFRQTSGTGDPLVRITSGHRLRQAAFDAGLDVWYTEYPNSSHCFLVPAIAGGWMKNHVPEMADLLRAGRRPTAPARVRYMVDARHYPAGPEVIGVHDLRDMGVRYAGAYWVSGVVVRPEVEAEATRLGTLVAGNSIGGPGREVVAYIDAASHGAGGAYLEPEPCGDSIGFAGLQGGNPSALPDEGGSTGLTWNNPNHWKCQAQRWTGDAAPVLDLAVHNLAAATVDLRDAGLLRGPSVTVRAAGDGPLALTLAAPGLLTATGPCLTGQSATPGALTLQLSLGDPPCELTVTRGG